MNALTGQRSSLGPRMIRNVSRLLLGLSVTVAPAGGRYCSADPQTVVIPQRKAPQGFLVQDAETAVRPVLQPVSSTVPSAETPTADTPPAAPVQIPISDYNLRASLRGVVLQCTQLTNEGVVLATKGAAYSARSKFLSALQLIADALDARHNTQFHSRALSSGAVACFAKRTISAIPIPRPAGDADPIALASSHVTPILKEAHRGSVTRLQALQLYYSYATSQFSAAVGGIPEAANAIYYLGRLQPFLGGSVERNALLAEPKALALEQAALSVDPRNYRAANELGVLLARCGQYEPARKALLYSASIERHPEIFQNLAYVYSQMGDRSDAQSMQTLANEERRLHVGGSSTAPQLVYLVDHKTFAGDAPVTRAGGTMEAPPPPPPPGSRAEARALEPTYEAPAPAATQYAAPPVAAPGPQEVLEPLSWEVFAQGEFIGPARLAYVPEYYLRCDDQVSFVFRLNGKPMSTPYRLNVGDVIRVSSLTLPTLLIDTPIQPDGTIILPQVGPIMAAGKSIEVLRGELDDKYKSVMREPSISVIPVTLNKTVEELRAAITNRTQIYAGQSFTAKISPNGTVQLPGACRLGPSPQGLLADQNCAAPEVEARYAEIVPGFEVTPVLVERAPRVVYVLGEVGHPGKFALDAPTTVIQAIAMAGSWNIGGNLRQVIVFRRDAEWRLMATRVNVRPALYNSRDLDAQDIWLRDNDIVIVPKCPLQVIDDYITLIFTKGIYGVVPFQGVSFTFFRDLSAASTAVLP